MNVICFISFELVTKMTVSYRIRKIQIRWLLCVSLFYSYIFHNFVVSQRLYVNSFFHIFFMDHVPYMKEKEYKYMIFIIESIITWLLQICTFFMNVNLYIAEKKNVFTMNFNLFIFNRKNHNCQVMSIYLDEKKWLKFNAICFWAHLHI